MARDVTLRVLEHGLPEQTLINVNVPGMPPNEVKGVRITRMGGRRYDANEVVERHDPYGQPYYWLGGSHADRRRRRGRPTWAPSSMATSASRPITLDMTQLRLPLAPARRDLGLPSPEYGERRWSLSHRPCPTRWEGIAASFLDSFSSICC